MQTLQLEQLRVAGVLHSQEIVSEAILGDQMESLMRHSLPGEEATKAGRHADAAFTAKTNLTIRKFGQGDAIAILTRSASNTAKR
jgi:hypothetical protein